MYEKPDLNYGSAVRLRAQELIAPIAKKPRKGDRRVKSKEEKETAAAADKQLPRPGQHRGLGKRS